MTPIKRTTVLLADDHWRLRQSLRALLLNEADLEIVGEAADGSEAVELTTKLLPEVVVMDLAMPKLNGLEATRRIAHQAPQVKVLVLSSYSDDALVQELIEAGAVGYLLKHSAANGVIAAVREAAEGKASFSPAISRCLFNHYRHFSPGRSQPGAGLWELCPARDYVRVC